MVIGIVRTTTVKGVKLRVRERLWFVKLARLQYHSGS